MGHVYISIFLLWCLLSLTSSLCLADQEAPSVLGCHGFVRWKNSLNVKDEDQSFLDGIQVGVLNAKNNVLKESTDCAPKSGYFFLPLYSFGSYVLKVISDENLDITPSQVAIEFDGSTDICSQGKDVIFEFIGFSISGSLIFQNSNNKDFQNFEKEVSIQLTKIGDKSSKFTTTDGKGRFSFKALTAGQYSLKIDTSDNEFSYANPTQIVNVLNSNVKDANFAILGYEVESKIVMRDVKSPENDFGLANMKFELIGNNVKFETHSTESGGIRFGNISRGFYRIKPVFNLKSGSERHTFIQEIKYEGSDVDDSDLSSANFKVKNGKVKLGKFSVSRFCVRGSIEHSEKGGRFEEGTVVEMKTNVGKRRTSVNGDSKFEFCDLKPSDGFKFEVNVISRNWKFEDNFTYQLVTNKNEKSVFIGKQLKSKKVKLYHQPILLRPKYMRVVVKIENFDLRAHYVRCLAKNGIELISNSADTEDVSHIDVPENVAFVCSVHFRKGSSKSIDGRYAALSIGPISFSSSKGGEKSLLFKLKTFRVSGTIQGCQGEKPEKVGLSSIEICKGIEVHLNRVDGDVHESLQRSLGSNSKFEFAEVKAFGVYEIHFKAHSSSKICIEPLSKRFKIDENFTVEEFEKSLDFRLEGESIEIQSGGGIELDDNVEIVCNEKDIVKSFALEIPLTSVCFKAPSSAHGKTCSVRIISKSNENRIFKVDPPNFRISVDGRLESNKISMSVTHIKIGGVIKFSEKFNIDKVSLKAVFSDHNTKDVKLVQNGKSLIFEYVAEQNRMYSNLKLIPESKYFYFEPKSISASNADRKLEFQAKPALFIKGVIEPKVKDVEVTLGESFEVEKIDDFKAVSNENGIFYVGPLPQSFNVEKCKFLDLKLKKENFEFLENMEQQSSGGDDRESKSLIVRKFVSSALSSLKVKIQTTDDDSSASAPLSGVVVSISGGPSSYRKSLYSDNLGEIAFNSLLPGEYFVKAFLKEWNFEPKHHIVQLSSSQNSVTFKGKRTSYSAYGRLVHLGGKPYTSTRDEQKRDPITISAFPTSLSGTGSDPDCPPLDEDESTISPETAVFRISGLKPLCSYTLAIQAPHIREIVPYKNASTSSLINFKMPRNADYTFTSPLIVLEKSAYYDVNLLIKSSNFDRKSMFVVEQIQTKSATFYHEITQNRLHTLNPVVTPPGECSLFIKDLGEGGLAIPISMTTTTSFLFIEIDIDESVVKMYSGAGEDGMSVKKISSLTVGSSSGRGGDQETRSKGNNNWFYSIFTVFATCVVFILSCYFMFIRNNVNKKLND